MYTLKHEAQAERKIIERCMRERLPLPDHIINAPELFIGLELYLDAFWDLNSTRTSGWGLGPVPWSAINDFASTFELDEFQRDDLHYYVRVLDNAYIEHYSKKGKISPDQGASSSSKSGWLSGPSKWLKGRKQK